METMTVKKIGYQIVGMAALLLAFGDEGTIPMKPVKLMQTDYPTQEQIREAINGGSYWDEHVTGALVRVDTLWDHGARTYGDTEFINISGFSDSHVLNILSIDHPESPVCVFNLPEEILVKAGLA